MRALKQEIEALNEIKDSFYNQDPEVPLYEEEPVQELPSESPADIQEQINQVERQTALDTMSIGIKRGLNNISATNIICDERFAQLISVINNIDFTALSTKDLTSFYEVIEEVSDGSWGAFDQRCKHDPSLNNQKR